VAILLRRSYRDNGNAKSATLGNLAHLPDRLTRGCPREIGRRATAAVALGGPFGGGGSNVKAAI
jgi:hypothetical protein